jgi:hypothetical protein
VLQWPALFSGCRNYLRRAMDSTSRIVKYRLGGVADLHRQVPPRSSNAAGDAT